MSMMNGSAGKLAPTPPRLLLLFCFIIHFLVDSNLSANYSFRKSKRSSKYTATNGGLNSSSLSSITKSASGPGPTSDSSGGGGGGYGLHEQSEKRFGKWLAEIEQSLEFIEKRLAAESALNNQESANITNADSVLYSNISEMQQMHMNYFEKIKVSR